MNIQILAVNEFGHEVGNSQFSDGRDLPVLQDLDNNINQHSDVWKELWDVTYRDVVVLNAASERVAVYNLTVNNLAEPEKFEELRNLLIDNAIRDQRPWCNANGKLDVNSDGAINLSDATAIVESINLQGSRQLPTVLPTGESLLYFDTNFDGYVSPIDVLGVVRHVKLNRIDTQAEGEPGSANYWVGPSRQEIAAASGTSDSDLPKQFAGTMQVFIDAHGFGSS